MQIFIEDITDDYGTDGVSVYSLVHGMDCYVGEVRASGITLFESASYGDGQNELDNEHKDYEILIGALIDESLVGER